MKSCISTGYVDLQAGSSVTCTASYAGVYYWAGVVDVTEGNVEIRLRAGPRLDIAVSEQAEAPSVIVLTPVLVSGSTTLEIYANVDSRVWHRIYAVDIIQSGIIASIVGSIAGYYKS